jgi:hypothetical protein
MFRFQLLQRDYNYNSIDLLIRPLRLITPCFRRLTLATCQATHTMVHDTGHDELIIDTTSECPPRHFTHHIPCLPRLPPSSSSAMLTHTTIYSWSWGQHEERREKKKPNIPVQSSSETRKGDKDTES